MIKQKIEKFVKIMPMTAILFQPLCIHVTVVVVFVVASIHDVKCLRKPH